MVKQISTLRYIYRPMSRPANDSVRSRVISAGQVWEAHNEICNMLGAGSVEPILLGFFFAPA